MKVSHMHKGFLNLLLSLLFTYINNPRIYNSSRLIVNVHYVSIRSVNQLMDKKLYELICTQEFM